MLQYQWTLFKTAVMFLTRIPVGKNLPYSQELLQASARYFTWVGILVGITGGVSLYLANLVFSPALSIAVSMLSTILLTGSFHEDGLADSCDAFGGGWTKEKILTIMKDSRLGTYGVVGLVAALVIKFLLLLELFSYIPVTTIALLILCAHSFSRLMAVSIMQQLAYVQDIDASKSKPLADRVLNTNEGLILLKGFLIPFIFLYYCSNLSLAPYSVVYLLLSLVPAMILRYFAGNYFKKWIGGYTGDCLGATQQVCEIAFYFGSIFLWKFI
ncbi:MAG: adenosylcobinamide-GDP ribazoletransferase [Sediminibacterium sp.]|nr:adenosylcobinamide-GDP ribazoletransferase [Sediminibacterium sp.]TXT32932.1 MAG: adenosylcobinamide-GDP ribazoletransferase [Chitinophagaceae bacterium]